LQLYFLDGKSVSDKQGHARNFDTALCLLPRPAREKTCRLGSVFVK